jgi:hypothetical protein
MSPRRSTSSRSSPIVHQVRETVGDRVELVVDRRLAAALSVLEQRDEEECDDRCRAVDDELPRVRVAEQRERGRPDQHDDDAPDEERRAAVTPAAAAATRSKGEVIWASPRACCPAPSPATPVPRFAFGSVPAYHAEDRAETPASRHRRELDLEDARLEI